jgi:putative ABC transport system permease protein
MIKNYFKVAFRNILKHKFFSLINILGMTIGVTACLFIVLYVSDELSYDKFHARADRMYQVGLHGKIAGQEVMTSTTCPPLAAALMSDIPGVEETTRLDYYGSTAFKYNDKAFTEEKIFSADSNFFHFFSFRLKEGDPKTALKEPNTIVLTEKLAAKYFGDESPLGKLVTVGNDNVSYKVTGIAEDCPVNSHVIYSALLSASSSEYLKGQEWLSNGMFTYFIAEEKADIQSITAKFEGIVSKYVGPEIERIMEVTLAQMEQQGGAYGYYATKVTDLRLHAVSQDFIEPPGNIMYVYFFGGVGILIVVIACINFMNLSTAQSAGRAKEVGLRKTLGSLRGQMIGQFLAESMLYSSIAIVLALAACYLLLPSFNILSGKQLEMNVLLSPVFIGGAVSLVLFVGLIAGSYPAFYLTSFSPVEVLKGKVRAGMKSGGVRSVLVVFQFALSIFLIIFTAVVYQQINFMQERNMGIDKHNVLIIQNTNRLGTNRDAFKNSITSTRGIVKACYTSNSFPGVNNTTIFKSSGSDQDHIMGIYYADFDQQDVLKFEMKEGRYFSRDFPSDSGAVVLNEAAVKEFGFQNPLQEEIRYYTGDTFTTLKVVGVYKDFNFETLKSKVRPLAIRLRNHSNQLMVRYDGKSQDAIAALEKLWKQQAANEPFDYKFLDENFDELFRAEQRMSEVFSVFSGLAIFIACLGLFALAAFTAEQRTKEIGIRKALGASSPSLVILLSKEFTRLVIIAFIPAAAVGWWVIQNWLNSFEYRVDINPLIFVGSGLAAILIAWLTVGYQAVKAAKSDPVKSLRYE